MDDSGETLLGAEFGTWGEVTEGVWGLDTEGAAVSVETVVVAAAGTGAAVVVDTWVVARVFVAATVADFSGDDVVVATV